MNRYFPEGRPKPITEKWKRRALRSFAVMTDIKDTPDLRGQICRTFREKV